MFDIILYPASNLSAISSIFSPLDLDKQHENTETLMELRNDNAFEINSSKKKVHVNVVLNIRQRAKQAVMKVAIIMEPLSISAFFRVVSIC